MTAYAAGLIRDVNMGPDIAVYLERIDATLEPFGGRFLIHGEQGSVMEGDWPGDLVVIAFPDRASAHAWYTSPAYQDILALRTRNADSDVIVVDGVGPDHRATDILDDVGGDPSRAAKRAASPLP